MSKRPNIAGDLNPNWRGGRAVTCAACAALVWVGPSRLRRLNYCSSVCSGSASAGSSNPRWAGGPASVECRTCGTAFVASRREINRGRAKFCGPGCAASAKRKPMTEERAALRRINNSMTVLMHRTLGAAKGGRRWQDLAGYTALDLKRHLENRFVDGMTWSNSGAWHIDHIRPKASFTFASAEEPAFRECWALSNLQPLWATENLKKGARLVGAA